MLPKYFKKLIFYLVYIVCLLLLLEIGLRIFLTVKEDAPFFRPKKIIYQKYPVLKEIKERREIKKEDEYFDILFLGGSVLNTWWGTIEPLLHKKLTDKTTRKIRIHNLAQKAQTSLDSLYKYKYLPEKEFDLVVFYHGVNEVRANNCPAELFENDYSHYAWYNYIKALTRHKEINVTVSPYVLHYLFLRIKEKLKFSVYVPVDTPRDEWLEYGSEIKTKYTFRKNLSELLDIAKKKKEPVLLMTFTFYLPDEKALEKLDNETGRRFESSIAIFGKPENVIKGIETHNAVIKELAENYENTMFVDQHKLMPKNTRCFHDVCHFTEEGCEEFVDNITGEILLEISHKTTLHR